MFVSLSVDSALLELGYEAAWFAPFSILTEREASDDDGRTGAAVVRAAAAAGAIAVERRAPVVLRDQPPG